MNINRQERFTIVLSQLFGVSASKQSPFDLIHTVGLEFTTKYKKRLTPLMHVDIHSFGNIFGLSYSLYGPENYNSVGIIQLCRFDMDAVRAAFKEYLFILVRKLAQVRSNEHRSEIYRKLVTDMAKDTYGIMSIIRLRHDQVQHKAFQEIIWIPLMKECEDALDI